MGESLLRNVTGVFKGHLRNSVEFGISLKKIYCVNFDKNLRELEGKSKELVGN